MSKYSESEEERDREERYNRRRLEAIEQEKADTERERAEAEIERTKLSRDEIKRKRSNKAKQLLAAAATGDIEIIDDLVVRDGTVDIDEIYEDETALLRAIRANQTALINHLIKRGADVNKSLSICIAGGSKFNETVIDKLLEMGADIKSKDELFEEAARIIVEKGLCSASLLQRRLNLDNARAERIMDQLHYAGLVGLSDDNEQREVLVRPDEIDDMLAMLRQQQG